MSLFKQKKVAVICCVLMVLIAIPFGAHRSLTALQRDAAKVYANGDDTGLSILANLNSIGEYSATLVKTAGSCYDTADTAYADLLTAHKNLLAADTRDPAVCRDALTELLTACTILQADYQGRSDIPEEAARLMNRSVNDIISMKDQMRHSGYNKLAADFNETLDAFPAGALAALTGIDPLPLF